MSDDLSDGWVAESNERAGDPSGDWWVAWESWFIEDDKEADALEHEYDRRGELMDMRPRPFVELLEAFKKLRPPGDPRWDWRNYRFRHVASGMIIHAWLLQ